MQQYHITPLFPWIDENTKKFFMQVNGEPYRCAEDAVFNQHNSAIPGDIGVLALDAQIPLLSVSANKELLARGIIDHTDCVAPNIYLTALYLTRPGYPVLRAACTVSAANKAAFQESSTDECCKLLHDTLPFKLDFPSDDGLQELEFKIEINGHACLEAGHIIVSVNRDPGRELRIVRQSVWCIRNQPLLGYKPAGYELLAGRINYNRRGLT